MYAVIVLPSFRLQAALRHATRRGAVAIVDHDKGLLLEVNDVAEALGIRPGMPAAQALARCPKATLIPRADAQERIVQHALLEVAASLSPEIESTAEGCCTADLRRAKIADWPRWGAQVVERLGALELHAQIGIAPNPDLAFLAARRARPCLVVQSPPAFLAQIALEEIDPPPHLLALLREWGVHTLGQLTSLPRGEFADRLGPEANVLWQRAAGRTERLLNLVRPVEEFVEAFEFEHEIETVEPLYFMLRRFLDQLALRLAGIHRVAARMRLILPLENGTTHERVFTIPAPTIEVDVLFRILEMHLDGLRLEQRPTGVRLDIEPAKPEHDQLRLFESPLRDANRFGETLARLAALVGHGNVGVPEVEDTHRPDRYQRTEPQFQKTTGESPSNDLRDLPTGLPLRRFRPPIPAQVQVVQQAPAWVVSETAHGRVAAATGPYRASGGWWDAGRWASEEWDVEIAGQGIYRLSRQNNEWFVEGCYDAELC